VAPTPARISETQSPLADVNVGQIIFGSTTGSSQGPRGSDPPRSISCLSRSCAWNGFSVERRPRHLSQTPVPNNSSNSSRGSSTSQIKQLPLFSRGPICPKLARIDARLSITVSDLHRASGSALTGLSLMMARNPRAISTYSARHQHRPRFLDRSRNRHDGHYRVDTDRSADAVGSKPTGRYRPTSVGRRRPVTGRSGDTSTSSEKAAHSTALPSRALHVHPCSSDWLPTAALARSMGLERLKNEKLRGADGASVVRMSALLEQAVELDPEGRRRLAQTSVYPRDIVKSLLLQNGAAVISTESCTGDCWRSDNGCLASAPSI
jgi:hypothetical protein